MSRKSGLFILMLIASGCLSKACGDGQISASPRSSEGEPTPDQPNVDEPVSGVTDVPSTVQPYAHVTPADIGVTIGVGVIAPIPTEAYTGSCTPAEGATIENVVVSGCSTLNIYNDNITIRNSILNMPNTVGIRMGSGGGSPARNLLVEYSDISQQSHGKMFQAFNGSGNGDYTNTIIRNNHLHGTDDYFYLEGPWDGAVFENNVIGPLFGTDEDDEHADGWQLGEVAPIFGHMIFRGNYFDPQTLATKTAILFSTGPTSSTNTVLFENNYLTVYGARTLWCLGPAWCIIRHNVYSPFWEAAIGNRSTGAQCDGGGGAANPSCGYPVNAANFGDKPSANPTSEYTCNRYASDGDFIEQQWVDGVTHDTAGCPAYTP